MSAQHGEQIARNTLVVAGATLISRGLGFLRDVIMAHILGAGMAADAFFVAFRVPNVLRRLFGEGSLTMAFIPVYSRVREEQGEEAANAMARAAMIWLGIILGGLTLLVEILAGPLTFLIAPGFHDNPELFALTTHLLRICFPYIILISGVALCMGILNSRNHFWAPAMAPVALNVALIAAALLAWAAGLSVAVAMAWGVLVGGALQLMMQQAPLHARGHHWRGPFSLRDPGVRRMAVLMLPTVFGAAVYQLNILLGTLLSSFLPEGSVSFLYYADRIVEFPLGVFGIAVSTAALPSMARLIAKGDEEGYAQALSSSLGLTLYIALPAMAGLLALSGDIVGLLFGRGAFDAHAVTATSAALVAYSAGLPGFAMSRPMVAAFYSREDMRTPVLVAAACLVINIGLGAWLMHPLAHVGLALAVTISSTTNWLLLHVLFIHRYGHQPLPIPSALKCLALSTLVFLGAWTTKGWGWWWVPLMAVWAAAYFLASHLWHMPESQLFMNALMGRLRRRKR